MTTKHGTEDATAAALLEVATAIELLRAAVTPSLNGNALPGARPVTLAGSPVASQKIATTSGRLVGCALRETTGAAGAVIRLRHGIDVNGEVLVPITLAAGESTRDAWPLAVSFIDGLYFELVSGAVEGAVFLGAVD